MAEVAGTERLVGLLRAQLTGATPLDEINRRLSPTSIQSMSR
jgi:hypothetical protein